MDRVSALHGQTGRSAEYASTLLELKRKELGKTRRRSAFG